MWFIPASSTHAHNKKFNLRSTFHQLFSNTIKLALLQLLIIYLKWNSSCLFISILGCVPVELTLLKNLKKVDLSLNQLTGFIFPIYLPEFMSSISISKYFLCCFEHSLKFNQNFQKYSVSWNIFFQDWYYGVFGDFLFSHSNKIIQI